MWYNLINESRWVPWFFLPESAHFELLWLYSFISLYFFFSFLRRYLPLLISTFEIRNVFEEDFIFSFKKIKGGKFIEYFPSSLQWRAGGKRRYRVGSEETWFSSWICHWPVRGLWVNPFLPSRNLNVFICKEWWHYEMTPKILKFCMFDGVKTINFCWAVWSCSCFSDTFQSLDLIYSTMYNFLKGSFYRHFWNIRVVGGDKWMLKNRKQPIK